MVKKLREKKAELKEEYLKLTSSVEIAIKNSIDASELKSEIAKIQLAIKNAEEDEANENSNDEGNSSGEEGVIVGTGQDGSLKNEDDEDEKSFTSKKSYRKDFFKTLRGKMSAVSLNEKYGAKFTSGDNAVNIPDSIDAKIEAELKQNSVLWPLISKSQLKGTLQLNRDSKTITVAYTSEDAVISPSDPTFVGKTLNFYKIAGLVKLTHEALKTSNVDLENYIAAELGQALARFYENEIMNGTGSNAILGIIPDGDIVTEEIDLGTPDWDTIVSFIYSQDHKYRKNSKLVMADSTYKILLQAKGSDGHPFVEFVSIDGMGKLPFLMGQVEILISDYISSYSSALTTEVYAIMGDFSKYRINQQPGGMTLDTSMHFDFAKGNATLRIMDIADGAAHDPRAFVNITKP